MTLVHLVWNTEILKYQIAEYTDPLDYMRAAVAAIRSGQPSSIHSNPIIILWLTNTISFYMPVQFMSRIIILV